VADGVTLVPWRERQVVVLGVTVTCSLAESYIDRAALEAGAAAEMAATRKEEKYVGIGARYIFEPIAVETLGVFNPSARHLLDDLGRRISESLGDEARETSFLYKSTKRCRFWCSASMLSFCTTVCRLQTAQTDDRTQFCIYFTFLKLPKDYMYRW